MFKIAICDDNKDICNTIEGMIDAFFQTENINYETDIFVSGEELIFSLEEKEVYDLIYLDIELDTLNGVKVGKYIREQLCNDTVQIAFVSAKIAYAMELFQIRPIDFLVKPFTKENVQKVLNKALDLKGRQTRIFTYISGRAEKRIAYKNIIYFSSYGKKISIHMQDGSDSFYGKLSALELPREDFIFVHKSFIVNQQHVVQFKSDIVVLSNGEVLPISRVYRKKVREELKLLQKGEM